MAKVKKIKTILKLNLSAGAANPAPPVGTALGPHGVNIMEFCNAYNEKTKDKRGQILPAEVTIFEDRTFTFVVKLPPVSEMIKIALNIKKGGSTPGKAEAATMTKAQLEAVATEKMPDLNTTNLEAAMRSVTGTAKSMGIKIV